MAHSSPILCVDNHSTDPTFAAGAKDEIVIWSYGEKGEGTCRI
jgi:hypothetical protein